MDSPLCSDLRTKFDHLIERIDHLIGLVPGDRLDWVPPQTNGFSFNVLLGHLMDCLAGITATLYAAKPDELGHFLELRKLAGNQQVSQAEARNRLRTFQQSIEQGFSILSDAQLGRMIPTVFVPKGESLLTLLLINFEHLASHKYQLFLWLRMSGVKVESRDLYHFSGQ